MSYITPGKKHMQPTYSYRDLNIGSGSPVMRSCRLPAAVPSDARNLGRLWAEVGHPWPTWNSIYRRWAPCGRHGSRSTGGWAFNDRSPSPTLSLVGMPTYRSLASPVSLDRGPLSDASACLDSPQRAWAAIVSLALPAARRGHLRSGRARHDVGAAHAGHHRIRRAVENAEAGRNGLRATGLGRQHTPRVWVDGWTKRSTQLDRDRRKDP